MSTIPIIMTALKTFRLKVTGLNDWVAVRGTLVFGSMWMTYLFFVYGLAPLVFPGHMDKMLYWSNTVQLWSLPLLMVGTNLLGRISETRLLETHDAVMSELQALKDEHKALREIHEILKTSYDNINRKLDALASKLKMPIVRGE